jgi:glycosyltransferase involved in cell wall biosynthesis
MNVVMIGPFGLSPKSTMAVRALPLARALCKRGHHVTMLLPPWSNPQAAGTNVESEGVRVVNLLLPPGIPLLFHILLTIALVRRTLALRPDVVYCFKPKAYAGLAAWCLWQLRRMSIHRARIVLDTDDWEGAGGWNEVEQYPRFFKRFFSWQERWGLTHADAVTVASRALQTIVWSLGVARPKVYYVPNGIESIADAMLPKQAENASIPVLLLYTRFFEFDLDRIAQLFGVIASAIPVLQFLIVGKGFFGEEERFVHLLTSAKLGGRVTALGWPPEGGIGAVFERTTVAVFPFEDTLLNRTKCSVKLTELLSAGVPIVAEAVGQNVEYIRDGESGILVTPGDDQCFVAAVKKLLDDASLRGRIAAGAKARMRDYFMWERIAGEVESALAA